jgi:Leucine-rich repeat (LRR) protein
MEFSAYHSLTSLDLSQNRITEVSYTAFQDTMLQALNLKSNFLTRVPVLDVVGDMLKYFYLEDNLIAAIEDELYHLRLLYFIGLQSNRIEKMAHTALEGCRGSISTLNLGYNHLQEIDRRLFEGMTALTYLTIQGNSLTAFPDFYYLPSNNNLRLISTATIIRLHFLNLTP